MGIFGIGQGTGQPTQGDSANADSSQLATTRARTIVSGSAPLEAQALGSKRQQFNRNGNDSDTGPGNQKFGRQTLNSSGRGQIVNIVV